MKIKSNTTTEPTITLTFSGIEDQAEVEFVDDPSEPGWNERFDEENHDNRWLENAIRGNLIE